MTNPKGQPVLKAVRLLNPADQFNAFLLARDLLPLDEPARLQYLHDYLTRSLRAYPNSDPEFLAVLCSASVEIADAIDFGQIPRDAKFGDPGCGPWFRRLVH